MLQKTNQPNALNFFGIRKVRKPLPHFTYFNTKFDYGQEDKLDDWIRIHLKSRYYLAKILISSEKYVLRIGFEDCKELTLFTLGCPYITHS
jgi:hypothetical protein